MSQRSSGQAGRAGRDWPDDLWPGDDGQPSPAGPAGCGTLVGVAGPQPLPPGGTGVPAVPTGGTGASRGGTEASPGGTGALAGGAGVPPMPPGWPETAPRNRPIRPGVLAVIVVAAAAAGAGITAVAVHDLSTPGVTASGGTGPGGTGPGGTGSGGKGVPGGQGVPGGGLPGGSGAAPGGGPGAGLGRAGSLFLIGTVTAVSRTSITVGGPEHTVTAAVTGATRVTGKVSAVTGIKVGDRVSAQITHGGTGNVAVAIADPAQLPADGSLP